MLITHFTCLTEIGSWLKLLVHSLLNCVNLSELISIHINTSKCLYRALLNHLHWPIASFFFAFSTFYLLSYFAFICSNIFYRISLHSPCFIYRFPLSQTHVFWDLSTRLNWRGSTILTTLPQIEADRNYSSTPLLFQQNIGLS